MAEFKKGEWVRFWTRNWPVDVTSTTINVQTDEMKDTTDVGEYQNEGKIVRLLSDGCVVRVWTPAHGKMGLIRLRYDLDTIKRFDKPPSSYTLGKLRQLLASEEIRGLPDEMPLTVDLPQGFLGDEGLIPEDHPSFKDADSFASVGVWNVVWLSPQDDDEGDGWLTVIVDTHDCFDLWELP